MSPIKYCIFVFLVLIASQSYSQNKIEDDITLEKNKVEVVVDNADKEIQKGNFYSAIKTLKQALVISNNIDDKKGQGIILSKIAKLQYNVEEFKNAKSSITKAIAIQNSIDDKLNLSISRYTFGLIHLGQKDYKNALEYFKSAKTIFEEENINDLITEVTLSEAKAHIGLDNLNEANSLVEKTIILSKKHNLSSLLSAALIKSGVIACKQKKYNTALSQAEEGSIIAKNNGDLEILNESYFLLSNIYSELKNYELASKNLRLYIGLNDSILKSRSEELSPEKRAQFIIADKDAVIKLQADELNEKEEATSLSKLTTILSIGLITILSLLTLSLYKNNNIRLKTNNMLFKKNRELLTEKERAEIAATAKSNFLSTVTHELRTPLYAVTGLTKMLLEEDPKPDQIQHLKSLKFSGDYLLTFINDILQINKIEANKVELDPEIFNLRHKVENVAAALNNSALDNNIAIHIEYDKSLPEIFHGDQLKISQILINLIGNSIKFTKDGDIWVRILKVTQNQSLFKIRLEVEDNGIGITKEKQENMFESFSQGSIQINRKYGGTGLGLSIVKGLVDILRGKVYLKSELGQGTTFSIELPLKESKEVVKVEKKDLFKNVNDIDLSKINILIVEDNKINQMITKKILSKMKLNCEVVDNGEDAVDLVKENTYNIVLMDIHMPGISGIEATKRIRAFDKELTIFALTAVTLEDKMQEFDEAGFDDIISKPFKQEDFEKKLFSALFDNKSSASA
ncbi:MAG: hybrid sensor histidine kinase/response regulator [Bacteroidetes bacterium]|nr:MAG: hybrid sensor histidine kinase/response regulator [Bacteroidota bacterium]